VNATSNQVTIKLPGVAAAYVRLCPHTVSTDTDLRRKGYTVLFINTTAPNAVLATSEQFEIADGTGMFRGALRKPSLTQYSRIRIRVGISCYQQCILHQPRYPQRTDVRFFALRADEY
jgi:hypothetical protein